MTTLKNIAQYISPALTHVINICFETGICPQLFKTAEIIPLHKKSEKSNCNNYRPLALISNLAKIFDSLLNSRLTNLCRNTQ